MTQVTTKCPSCNTEGKFNTAPKHKSLISCKKCKHDYIYDSTATAAEKKKLFDTSQFAWTDEEDEEESEDEEPVQANSKYSNKENEISDNDGSVNDQQEKESDDDDLIDEPLLNIKATRKDTNTTSSIASTSSSSNLIKKPVFKPKLTMQALSKISSKPTTSSSQPTASSNKSKSSSTEKQPEKPLTMPKFDFSYIDDKYSKKGEESEDEEDEEEEKPIKRKKVKSILFDDDEDDDDDYVEEYKQNKKRKNKHDSDSNDMFSDVDDDEDSESDEEKPIKKKKKTSAAATNTSTRITRQERINIFDDLENIRLKSLVESDDPKVKTRYVYKDDGIYEKVDQDGLPDEKGNKLKMVLPRPRKRKQQTTRGRAEKVYQKGPYRYGPKVGNKFNPYILFNTEYRGKIRDLNPHIGPKELTSAVAKAYHELDPVEKEKWINYAREKREDLNEEVREEKMHDITKRIKMPPTAYVLFQKEEGHSYREKNKKEIGDTFASYPKMMAAAWKALSADERRTYQERSIRMRAEYREKYGDVHKLKMANMMQKAKAKKLQNKTLKAAQRGGNEKVR